MKKQKQIRNKEVRKDGKGDKGQELTSLITQLLTGRRKKWGVLEDFHRQGSLSRKRVRQLRDQIEQKGLAQREELQELVDNRIMEISKMLGIVTKRDLDRIHKRLDQLEKKLL